MAQEIDLVPLASSVIAGAATGVAAWVSTRDPFRNIKSALQVLREMEAQDLDETKVRQWKRMVEQQAGDTTSRIWQLKLGLAAVSAGFLIIVGSQLVAERSWAVGLYVVGSLLLVVPLATLASVTFFSSRVKDEDKSAAQRAGDPQQSPKKPTNSPTPPSDTKSDPGAASDPGSNPEVATSDGPVLCTSA